MIHPVRRVSHALVYDIRLKYKFLLSQISLILLPLIVLGFFLYAQLYDIIVSNTVLSEQALSAQTATALENALSRVTQASDTLSQNELIASLFPDAQESAGYDEVQVLTQLAESLTDGDLITEIRIYADFSWDAGGWDTDGGLIAPLASVTSTYWYGIFSSQDIDELYCPDLYLSASEEERYGSLAYIRRILSGSREIYIAVYFSEEQLSSILSSNVRTENAAAYILNERDAVVSSSSTSLSGAYYMSNETIYELTGGVNLYTTRTYQNDNIYVGYYEIGSTDWHLVTILSAASLTEAGNGILIRFLAVYAIFALLALAFSFRLSASISGRIAALGRQMQSVHHDRPARIQTAAPSRDEIGVLYDNYNYMSDEINDLLDEQARTARELRHQEFLALQAQINPHFLYNSLDMIRWMAQTGRPGDVTAAVQALSKFYKLTLSRKDDIDSLASELEHVSLYVQIMNMRFENRILFEVSVPDPLPDYEFPKLILQPIVENSIQHGIMEKPDKAGTIVITGWLEQGYLMLLVSDDGVGMSGEQVKSILTAGASALSSNLTADASAPADSKPLTAGGDAAPPADTDADAGEGANDTAGAGEGSGSGTNIGIYNTHARLQLLYGEDCGLSYTSTPGMGTDVQIRIPARPLTQDP